MTNATINAFLEIPLPEYFGIILFPVSIILSFRANSVVQKKSGTKKAKLWTHWLCLLSFVFFSAVIIQNIRLPLHRSAAGLDFFGSPSQWTAAFCIIDTVAAEIAGIFGRLPHEE